MGLVRIYGPCQLSMGDDIRGADSLWGVRCGESGLTAREMIDTMSKSSENEISQRIGGRLQPGGSRENRMPHLIVGSNSVEQAPIGRVVPTGFSFYPSLPWLTAPWRSRLIDARELLYLSSGGVFSKGLVAPLGFLLSKPARPGIEPSYLRLVPQVLLPVG